MRITVDSGASENVVSDELSPNIRTVPSKGSHEGFRYVAANGNSMPNRGEKPAIIVIEEGHRCLLNMQVTDVKNPLMSVSRVCDAGQSVMLRKNGGTIPHLATGQETKFHRVDNVYRLKARVIGGDWFQQAGPLDIQECVGVPVGPVEQEVATEGGFQMRGAKVGWMWKERRTRRETPGFSEIPTGRLQRRWNIIT